MIIEGPKFRDLKSSTLAERLRKIRTKVGAMKRGPFHTKEQAIKTPLSLLLGVAASSKRTWASFNIEVSGDAESKIVLLTHLQQVKGMLGFETTTLTALPEVLTYWLKNHQHEEPNTSSREQDEPDRTGYHSLNQEEAKGEILVVAGHKTV